MAGSPSGDDGRSPLRRRFANRWYLALYLVGGAAMTVVALGVAHRLRPAPDLARVSLAFGLIWSGLLLASGLIALVGQHAAVDLAVAGAATLVPSAADAAAALFGIGFIVWFTWAGRSLRRA